MADSGGIFVSYRREDTAAATGRLSDLLVDRFGRSRVFIDVDTIGYGQDFVQRINRAVVGCDVLLAPIGPRWLTAADSQGRRRIDDPDDFVATEIGTALQRGIPVVPVLVDGTGMVAASDLPPHLADLATRNATRLDRQTFTTDADRILASVQRIVETAEVRRSGRSRERAEQQPDGPTDSLEEIAHLLRARSRRRTRRWWVTYLVALLLASSLATLLVKPAQWGPPVAALAGLAWCVVLLRREIAAQRLLADQLPSMASVERIRRALSPRRVRFVGAACVVVSVLFGLDIAVLGGPQPAASSTTQPAGAR